jgi:Nif-specific regulatory protein
MSRLSLLVDLAALLPRQVDLDALLGTACERIAGALQADRATIWLFDGERGDLFTRVATLPELDQLRQPLDRGIAGFVARTGQLVRLDDVSADERFDPSADVLTGYRTKSMLVVPIRKDGAPLRGVLQVLNSKEGQFSAEDEAYLVVLAAQLAEALSMTSLRAEDASVPGVTLRGRFNRIIGRSSPMQAVYERVVLAAETDATVLLSGATGTGKGVFARAIHDNSPRSAGPFVVVDCTTLPAQLVESELFGHERGAFTGAERRVKGKIELAEGGTLFLDEIGDLPLESQGKLLRLLQNREFERIGGRDTVHVDVRILCATHRDLASLARAGAFREDLYYRVRVVEIAVPELSARGPEEIDLLVEHFGSLYAKRHRRPVPRFSADLRRALHEHAWPGNVRELEHFVESAVVLSPTGDVSPSLLAPLRQSVARVATLRSSDGSGERAAILPEGAADATAQLEVPLGLSLKEVERRYAEASVAAADGNKTLAAQRLDIGRNTLTRLLRE